MGDNITNSQQNVDVNNIIESSSDKAFSKLHKLQFLLKKESALKELCKK
jgi:hypothetical protein